jgi:hypothetical protein
MRLYAVSLRQQDNHQSPQQINAMQAGYLTLITRAPC